MAEPVTPIRHRDEIDGLRALAVVPVMLYHAGFGAFHGGFVGVDVFFVISGFLITSIILAEQERGEFSLLSFYERRARRILPALFVVMLACIPLAWLWLRPLDLDGFSQSLFAQSIFASNFLFWHSSGYFDLASEGKPLIHTWSLSVEEQFYILFPAILLMLQGARRRHLFPTLLIIAVASLAVSQWALDVDPAAAFYLLPTRAWELLAGALAAVYLSSHATFAPTRGVSETLASAGLLMIVVALVSFDARTPFPGGWALLPTVGTACILLFATRETLVGKLLGCRVLVAVGLVSYSAYLWHQPLYAFLRHRSIDAPGTASFLLLTAVAFTLAWLSWRYVERPFRDRRRFSRAQLLGMGGACFAGLATVGLAGHAASDLVRDENPVELAMARQPQIGRDSACWGRVKPDGPVPAECVLGVPGVAPSFVLVGDSHASAIVAETSAAARVAGIAGLDLTHHSCPVLYGGSAPGMGKALDDLCVELRRDFFLQVQSGLLPRTLVVMSRWTMATEIARFDNGEGGKEAGPLAEWQAPGWERLGHVAALQASLAGSIRRMLDAGFRVILVYPVPEAGWDVPARLSKIYRLHGTLQPSDASTSYEAFVRRNARTYQAFDSLGELPGLVRIKPEALFCNEAIPGRCITHVDGAPLYYDDDHLSNVGARLLVAEIMKAMTPQPGGSTVETSGSGEKAQ